MVEVTAVGGARAGGGPPPVEGLGRRLAQLAREGAPTAGVPAERRAAELRHGLASRTLQAPPRARLAPPRSLEAPAAPCRGPTTGRMRRGGEGRNFASPIGCDAKCVRCLRRRLEGDFDTQMHCAEPILGLGSHLGMLLEST